MNHLFKGLRRNYISEFVMKNPSQNCSEQFSFKWVYGPNQLGVATEAAPHRCGQEGMWKKPLLLFSFLDLCIPCHFHFCSSLWALLKSISDTWRRSRVIQSETIIERGIYKPFHNHFLILQNGKLRPRNGDWLVNGHLIVTRKVETSRRSFSLFNTEV